MDILLLVNGHYGNYLRLVCPIRKHHELFFIISAFRAIFTWINECSTVPKAFCKDFTIRKSIDPQLSRVDVGGVWNLTPAMLHWKQLSQSSKFYAFFFLCGVPQGSILGLLLFIHCLTLFYFATASIIEYQYRTNDTLLFVAYVISNTGWQRHFSNRRTLRFLWGVCRESLRRVSSPLTPFYIKPIEDVRNLYLIFDEDLNF